MKPFLKNILNWSSATCNEADRNESVELSEFTGIYMYSVDEVLFPHQDLIDSTRNNSDVDDEQFELLYMPVIRKVASYAHALPASEADHHNDIFGLFKHSLEVGLHSLKFSQSTLFRGRGPSDVERLRAKVWRYSVWLTGFLHDIGKIVTDMRVFDLNEEVQWLPQNQSIHTWASQYGVSNIVIVWPKRIRGGHERSSAALINSIITADILNYLYSANNGNDVYDEILRAILRYKDARLTSIVEKADGYSVSQDLKYQSRIAFSLSANTSIQRLIVDSLRKLYHDPDSEGLFLHVGEQLGIIYPAAFNRAVELLRSLDINNVPADPLKIAHILIHAEYIRYDASERRFLFPLNNKASGATLDVVCWEVPYHIIGYAKIDGDSNLSWVSSNNNNSIHDETEQSGSDSIGTSLEQPDISAGHFTELDIVEDLDIKTGNIQAKQQSSDSGHSTSPESSDNAKHVTESQLTQSNEEQLLPVFDVESKQNNINSVDNSAHADQTELALDTSDLFEDPNPNLNNTETSSGAGLESDLTLSGDLFESDLTSQKKPELQPEQKKPRKLKHVHSKALMDMGDFGVILCALGDDIALGKKVGQTAVTDGCLAIQYPSSLIGYGRKPKLIYKDLLNANVLALKGLFSNDGKQYIVLNKKLTQLILHDKQLNTLAQLPVSPANDDVPVNQERVAIHDRHYESLTELVSDLIQDFSHSPPSEACIDDFTLIVPLKILEKYLIGEIRSNPSWSKQFIEGFTDIQLHHRFTRLLRKLSRTYNSSSNGIVLELDLGDL